MRVEEAFNGNIVSVQQEQPASLFEERLAEDESRRVTHACAVLLLVLPLLLLLRTPSNQLTTNLGLKAVRVPRLPVRIAAARRSRSSPAARTVAGSE